MRFESFFCGLLAMGISGCGGVEESTGARSAAPTVNPGTSSDEVNLPSDASATNPKPDLPYQLVETTTDGSRVIEYQTTVLRSEVRVRVTESGAEEQYSVLVPHTESRQASVPPGVDIQDFLAWPESGVAPTAAAPDSGNPAPAEPE